MALTAATILQAPVDFRGEDTIRPTPFEDSNRLIALIKHVVQRIILIILCPAQSDILKAIIPPFKTDYVDACRQKSVELLNENYTVRSITLQKNGTLYRGLMITHKKTHDNGRWVVQATGNGELAEYCAPTFASHYANADYNTILMNGPNTGLSEGDYNQYTMGEAQQVAIEYVEKRQRAANIVLAGRSQGAAEITEAIKQHTLNPALTYTVVRQVAYDSTANVCAQFVGHFVPFLTKTIRALIQWVELNTDNIAMSKWLTEQNIQEVILQNSELGSDTPCDDFPIVAQATLAHTLVQEKIFDKKTFYPLGPQDHMTNLAIIKAAKFLRSIH